MNRNTCVITLLGLFLLAMFISVSAALAYDDRSGEEVVIGEIPSPKSQ